MNSFPRTLVVAVCLACGFFILKAAWLMWRVASHPLAEDFDPIQLLIYSVPFVVAAFSALGLEKRPVALFFLLLTIILFGSLVTFLHQELLEETLKFLDCRAQGMHGMNCGPPVLFLCLAIVWFFFFVPLVVFFGVLALSVSVGRKDEEIGQFSAIDNK